MHKARCTPLVATIATVYLPAAKNVTTIDTVTGQTVSVALRAQRGNVVVINTFVATSDMNGTTLSFGGLIVTFQTGEGDIKLLAPWGSTRYVVGDAEITGLTVQSGATGGADEGGASIWLEGDVVEGDPSKECGCKNG